MQLFDTAAGKGDRDGLISREDLAAIANYASMPDALRTAAKMFIDSPAAFNAADVAAHGGEMDGLVSTADLDTFIARDLFYAPVKTPTTIKEAAQVLRNHMSFIDTAAGKGERDGLISREDLRAIRNDASIPEALRTAAKMMLESPTAFNAADVASRGGENDGKISAADLQAFIAKTHFDSSLKKPTNAKEAARILKDNLNLVDTAAGKGEKDGLISREDLRAVINDATLPEALRTAAKMLLVEHPLNKSMIMRSKYDLFKIQTGPSWFTKGPLSFY